MQKANSMTGAGMNDNIPSDILLKKRNLSQDVRNH